MRAAIECGRAHKIVGQTLKNLKDYFISKTPKYIQITPRDGYASPSLWLWLDKFECSWELVTTSAWESVHPAELVSSHKPGLQIINLFMVLNCLQKAFFHLLYPISLASWSSKVIAAPRESLGWLSEWRRSTFATHFLRLIILECVSFIVPRGTVSSSRRGIARSLFWILINMNDQFSNSETFWRKEFNPLPFTFTENGDMFHRFKRQRTRGTIS